MPLKYSSNLNSGLLFLNCSNFIDEEHCVTLKKIKNINNINVNQNETENETINENDFNNNFEIFEYKKTKEDETETDECSICIDTIQEGQEVVKLPCKHLYHSSCIRSYLLNYNNKCPLCRNSCMN